MNANRQEIGANPAYTAAEVTSFKAKGGTDWQDQIFRMAMQQSHQVSVSGGGQNVSYYLSGNFIDNNGIIKRTSFKRYSLRSNIESQLSDKLKADINLFLSQSTDHPTALNRFTGANGGSPVFAARLWAPTLSVYDSLGNYTLPSGKVGTPPEKTDDHDFDPGAATSSTLSVSLSSSNTDVATIVDGKIHLVGPGSTTITASQPGDATYAAATSLDQILTVNLVAAPDLGSIMSILPATLYGTSPITVMVDVLELKSVGTSGPINTSLSKDPLVSLSFNAELTTMNGRSVQNSAWRLDDSDQNVYCADNQYGGLATKYWTNL